MNIVVGFNSFQPETRQQVSLNSWKHLLQNDHIQNLYDIQFEDEQNINHDDVETLFELKRSSLDIVSGSTKKLPVVRDILDTLSTKCEPDDYFIFTNNDVILNKNLIKHIKQEALKVARHQNIHTWRIGLCEFRHRIVIVGDKPVENVIFVRCDD